MTPSSGASGPGDEDHEPAAEESSELTRKTLAGVQWAAASTVVIFALQLAYQAIINRLLEPEAFGVVALAWLVLRFTEHFIQISIGDAIIQKPRLDDRDIRVAFSSTMTFAVLLCGVVWLIAPALSAFFDEPAATPVLRAMSFTLLFSGLGGVALGVLRRRMQFRSVALRESVAYLVGYPIVGVAAAFAGFGIWSLVAAALSSTFTASMLALFAARHPMRPLMERSRFVALYSYSSRVSVIGVLEYLGQNLDTAAVGRFARTALLGQYSRAYYLTAMPTGMITRGIAEVAFPGLSRIQTDVARLGHVYLDSIRMGAFILLPICAGLGAAAPDLVRVVLGPQWGPAAQILPILAAAAAVDVLSHFAGVLCAARAELNRKLALQASYVVVLLVFLWLARDSGLWAFATALAAARALQHAMYVRLVASVLEIRARRLLAAYVPGLLTAVAVAAAMLLARSGLVLTGASAFVILPVTIAVAALVLAASLRFGPFKGMRSDLASRLRQAGMIGRAPLIDRGVRLLLGRSAAPS